jgi:hypothetical protein
MKNHLKLAAGIALITSAHAAVIANPTLASGPGNVIDPAGGETVDVSFGTAKSTLEARSDLRVLQDYTGFTSGGNNIVSNTISTLPDIQFQWSGDFRTDVSGSNTTNSIYATSDGSAMQQRNNDPGSNSSTLTISFGTWDGLAFTNNHTVLAAGFTLTHVYSNKSGVVTFRDTSGTALTGGVFNYIGESNTDGSSPGNHRDIYFGWDSEAELTSAIGSITITFVDSAGAFLSGFDDLAFTTVIPEPSVALLGGLGLLALLRRRR